VVPPLTVHGVERDPDCLRFLVSCILIRVQSFNDPL
jgi:hypothetical protein